MTTWAFPGGSPDRI